MAGAGSTARAHFPSGNHREIAAGTLRKLIRAAGVTVDEFVADESPDAYERLVDRLLESPAYGERWARHWRRSMPSLVEAWPQHNIDQEQRIFETDPWTYGLEANRHVIRKFLAYCHEQGISARNLTPEELFVESTWSLRE